MPGIMDIVLKVVGGLGIFLYGMESMSEGMQRLAGERLKKIISALTTNRFMALLVGIVATVIVQSSSVTTVMVIGFVNALLMNLSQALGVILGANIGTTVTGWVLVLKIGKYGLPMAGLGALMGIFSRDSKGKYRSMLIMGLGMIFFGLELMSDGFRPLRSMPEFIELFQKFHVTGFGSLLMVATVGALLTALVQSSSATLGITITLAAQGLIDVRTGVALVLGLNVGTTITALLASIGAKPNAKRAAYAHTIINIVGIIWILPIYNQYLTFLDRFTDSAVETTRYLATAHTIFNIVNALLFVPFLPLLSKLLEKFVKGEEKVERKFTHLDRRILETPSLALDVGKKEIVSLDNVIKGMFEYLKEAIGANLDSEDKKVRMVFDTEDRIDLIQKEMFGYLKELLKKDMLDTNVDKARNQLALVDEYESLSDYITDIMKLHLKLKENNLTLNAKKKSGIYELQEEIEQFLEFVGEAYRNNRKDIMIDAVNKSNKITSKFKKLRDEHLTRIVNEDVDPMVSSIYMDILTNYRKLKSHIYHVAEVISGEKAI